MTSLEVALLLVMLVGVVGTVVPVLPGTLLVLAAVLVWGVAEQSAAGWAVTAACVALLAVGAVIKYAVPGRRLSVAGVPKSTLLLGAALGLLGFFVIPIVGLPVGFVAGIWIAERQRVGADLAGSSTKAALRAVGLSILIELTAVLLTLAVWLVAAVTV